MDVHVLPRPCFCNCTYTCNINATIADVDLAARGSEVIPISSLSCASFPVGVGFYQQSHWNPFLVTTKDGLFPSGTSSASTASTSSTASAPRPTSAAGAVFAATTLKNVLSTLGVGRMDGRLFLHVSTFETFRAPKQYFWFGKRMFEILLKYTCFMEIHIGTWDNG